jgi:hypothetical protein
LPTVFSPSENFALNSSSSVVAVGRARAADRLRDLDHVLDGLVDPDEEGDLDVGADVVAADEALLAAPVDLDRLDRDVHDLRLVDDREDDAPVKVTSGSFILLTISALPCSTFR